MTLHAYMVQVMSRTALGATRLLKRDDRIIVLCLVIYLLGPHATILLHLLWSRSESFVSLTLPMVCNAHGCTVNNREPANHCSDVTMWGRGTMVTVEP